MIEYVYCCLRCGTCAGWVLIKGHRIVLNKHKGCCPKCGKMKYFVNVNGPVKRG